MMKKVCMIGTCILLMLGMVGLAAAEDAPGKPEESQPAAAPTLKTQNNIVARGASIETNIGAMLSVAGKRGYSNAQPFLGLEFAFDLTDYMNAYFNYSYGSVENNAVAKYTLNPDGSVNYSGKKPASKHFSISNFTMGVGFNYLFTERWAWIFKTGGGISLVSPKASLDQDSVSYNVMASTGVEYFTHMKDITVGIRTTFYYLLPQGIPAISFFPTFRYIF